MPDRHFAREGHHFRRADRAGLWRVRAIAEVARGQPAPAGVARPATLVGLAW
ncbi:hypothetical protein [Micromonospora sp. NPDC049497]|uniref:hypothetical protein n=1 Tax=Micromonospora sp. NPDC049497 TaxID=3364273 RepID=UPI0037AF81E1